VAGTAKTALYFQTAICWMLYAGNDVFFFEAFDEPNKSPSTLKDDTGNTVTISEAHWGVFDSNRNLKQEINLKCPEAKLTWKAQDVRHTTYRHGWRIRTPLM
jgi:hypothetical protein